MAFSKASPFYSMVSTFLASAVGLGPVFNPSNPLGLDQTQVAVFYGIINPVAEIDMQQVLNQTLGAGITAAEALNGLCSMLVNTTYEAVKDHNDLSLEFEVFRHLRNAASHGNRFHFKPSQPSRPAAWRSFQIDHTKQGAMNPLHDTLCFGTAIGPADILLLLSDIELKLP